MSISTKTSSLSRIKTASVLISYLSIKIHVLINLTNCINSYPSTPIPAPSKFKKYNRNRRRPKMSWRRSVWKTLRSSFNRFQKEELSLGKRSLKNIDKCIKEARTTRWNSILTLKPYSSTTSSSLLCSTSSINKKSSMFELLALAFPPSILWYSSMTSATAMRASG